MKFFHSMREKIHALQKEIETVLDPNLPGHSQYFEAWKAWSEPDMKGLKKELKGFLQLLMSPYSTTQLFLQRADMAMCWARNAKKDLEKRVEEARKAVALAAMVWGIYWAEEVIKVRRKRQKAREVLEV